MYVYIITLWRHLDLRIVAVRWKLFQIEVSYGIPYLEVRGWKDQ